MHLDRVTMTGADNNTKIEHLWDLSVRYPFVEWGILVSASMMGRERFPSAEWMKGLPGTPGLSLHLCGKYVRDLLIGNITFPEAWIELFPRIQLNFHAEKNECQPVKFAKALASMGKKQFIFQVDGALGNKHMFDAKAAWSHLDIVPLFDVSGGAGIVPKQWPAPMPEFDYHGYAGGLGPHNLNEQIELIAKAAGKEHIWIDMETHVRSLNDFVFDLGKVGHCLEIAKPFVTA